MLLISQALWRMADTRGDSGQKNLMELSFNHIKEEQRGTQTSFGCIIFGFHLRVLFAHEKASALRSF